MTHRYGALMRRCPTFVSALLIAAVSVSGLAGCEKRRDEGNDRWAVTPNTNVEIDWDKVNKAYEAADGPEDLEKRINDIYKGDEVISISVHDQDDKIQVVTGFFDRDHSGTVQDPEKIFEIKREIVGEEVKYQTQGHGHYAGYASPMLGMMTGMMMGSMMASALSPGYSPRYTQPYRTDPARSQQLKANRAPRPSKASGTGRNYGNSGRSTGGGGRRGGGARFGIRRVGAAPAVRLSA